MNSLKQTLTKDNLDNSIKTECNDSKPETKPKDPKSAENDMSTTVNNQPDIVNIEGASNLKSSRILCMESNVESLAEKSFNRFSRKNFSISKKLSSTKTNDSLKTFQHNDLLPKASKKRKSASNDVFEDKNIETAKPNKSIQDSRPRKASCGTPQLNKIPSYFKKL